MSEPSESPEKESSRSHQLHRLTQAGYPYQFYYAVVEDTFVGYDPSDTRIPKITIYPHEIVARRNRDDLRKLVLDRINASIAELDTCVPVDVGEETLRQQVDDLKDKVIRLQDFIIEKYEECHNDAH